MLLLVFNYGLHPHYGKYVTRSTWIHMDSLVMTVLQKVNKQVEGKVRNFKLDQESKTKKSGKQRNSSKFVPCFFVL